MRALRRDRDALLRRSTHHHLAMRPVGRSMLSVLPNARWRSNLHVVARRGARHRSRLLRSVRESTSTHRGNRLRIACPWAGLRELLVGLHTVGLRVIWVVIYLLHVLLPVRQLPGDTNAMRGSLPLAGCRRAGRATAGTTAEWVWPVLSKATGEQSRATTPDFSGLRGENWETAVAGTGQQGTGQQNPCLPDRFVADAGPVLGNFLCQRCIHPGSHRHLLRTARFEMDSGGSGNGRELLEAFHVREACGGLTRSERNRVGCDPLHRHRHHAPSILVPVAGRASEAVRASAVGWCRRTGLV